MRSGGGSVVTLEQANAIVCTGDDVELLRRSILPGVRWVQLGAAGVEMWFDAGLMTTGRRLDVGEGRLRETDRRAHPGLILAAPARPAREGPGPTWGKRGRSPRAGATVGVVGAGGIGTELIDLLAPLQSRTIALTRNGRSVPGADVSVGPERVAHPARLRATTSSSPAALTAETAGMISAEQSRSHAAAMHG